MPDNVLHFVAGAVLMYVVLFVRELVVYFTTKRCPAEIVLADGTRLKCDPLLVGVTRPRWLAGPFRWWRLATIEGNAISGQR